MISIGGNDLGFTPIIKSCIKLWGGSFDPEFETCEGLNTKRFDRLPEVIESVSDVIVAVKNVMAQEGYTFKANYRILLQSYPSPIPPGDKFRVADEGFQRITEGGCPVVLRVSDAE